MAEFWSNNDRGYRIRLWIDQTSQNIAGNSSQVRVRLALLNTTTTFASYNCSAWVDLNGQRLNWSGSPSVLSYNQTVWLIDQTITVGHNADGTKSFGLSASFSGSGGYSPGTLSIGGNSFTLTTIPRSSSVSAGAGTIGSALTININRQSSSFKHTVRYAWGSKSGTIASNVDTSVSWTIPNDFANDIPNSTSGTGTIYVDTYSGSTKTGTQSTSFSASVPSGMTPRLTGFTLTDSNTAVANIVSGNTFVQILSNIRVHFGQATGSYGSSITGYYAEIVGRNQSTTSNEGSLGIMNYNGTITIRARVTDSRGRTSNTIERQVTILEYFAPSLSFGVTRSGSKSSTFTINRNARIAPLNVSGSQKNKMTLSFKVARLGSTNYTVDNSAASGSWTTISSLLNSNANLSGDYAANQSWVVLGTLEDKFTRTEFAVNVATESVVLSYDRSGIGVNKIRERGALDVRGDIYANDKPIQQTAITQASGNLHYVSNYNNEGRDANALFNDGVKFYGLDKVSNMPFMGWFYMLNLIQSENYGVQIAIEKHKSNRLFIRGKEDGTWSNWDEMVKVGSNTNLANLNLTQTATTKISAMWGVKIDAVRKGNMVTLSIARNIYNIGANAEYAKMSETIPAGYRPIVEAHMTIIANSGSTIQGQGIVHLASNGEIRLTCNKPGGYVWTGTVTYLTNDAFP